MDMVEEKRYSTPILSRDTTEYFEESRILSYRKVNKKSHEKHLAILRSDINGQ